MRDAELAEAAHFDAIFHADSHALGRATGRDELPGLPDPIVILAALASRTSRIGLIATISTTFSHPFDMARKFATLQRLTRGRAGVNIVTSTSDAEAQNYGQERLDEPVTRYERATEYSVKSRATYGPAGTMRLS